MPDLLRRLVATAILLASLAGCGGPGATSPGTEPAPTPSPAAIDGPEDAARLVAQRSPLFEGIGPRDPDLIGQAASWEARPVGADATGGWQVVFRVGWGDCPAGCINEHTWTWAVTRGGGVTLVSEAGPVVPPDVAEGLSASGGRTGVAGRAVAGPTCPVERPGDPACAPRPVGGAELVVTDEGGSEVARLTTDDAGFFRIALVSGGYVISPQPVEGLMGTPAEMPFTVADGRETVLDLDYDTGIR